MVELKKVIIALLYIVLSIVFFLISKKKRRLVRIELPQFVRTAQKTPLR